jgi:hypothetical protein
MLFYEGEVKEIESSSYLLLVVRSSERNKAMRIVFWGIYWLTLAS